MIAHSIEQAKQSKYVTRVIVSTDSNEIKRTAERYGADVPFLRPGSLASDSAKAIDAYLHAINYLENHEQTVVETIMVLLPTVPLRKVRHIDEAIHLFNQKMADSVVSYCEEDHPISWHKHIDEDNRLEPIFEDSISNRQNYRKTYFPNGSMYIFKSSLLRQGKYYSENSYAYIMPKEYSADIDDELDFHWVEFLYSKQVVE